MKKMFVLIIIASLLAALVLTGCGQNEPPANTTDSENSGDAKTPNVVATIFPAYDFARVITQGEANIEMLLPPGAESHSFEPTPKDIMKIQDCDIFIYVGGDSDAWVDDILSSMDMSKKKIIALTDCVELVTEEIVEGMEDDHGHEHGHSHSDEEFDPDDVKDRPMSDFAGSWISGIPLIKDGSLDKYIEHGAEEEEITADEHKANLIKGWASDYDNIKTDGSTLEIEGVKAEYTYQGYQIIKSDHGSTVWYKYQIASPHDHLPSYLMFNDHGYGQDHEEEEQNHEGEEEHEEIAHIHLKYGNESFDALIAREGWSAFYFDNTHSHSEIGEFMAGDEHREEPEFDEHVWTSPRNAKLIVQKICDTLCVLDTANADVYKANTEAYLSQLDELDAKFKDVVNNAARRTIVFGDRFPFRYFADAYGLTYYAAFPGCSTETEPSVATVMFLIDKINNEKIPAVFHIELANEKMSETISEATGAKILLLHACHNISKADFDAGRTYLDIMTNNVDTLKEALN